MDWLDAIKTAATPWYLQIKFIHLMFATIWLWSTSVAFINYVVPAIRAWLNNPDDIRSRADRDLMMERFDRGVVLEHIAFPGVIITGLCLLIIGGWNADSLWLVIKLSLVILVFVPMEVFDYWLSHFGGNKANVRRRYRDLPEPAADAHYEQAIRFHWWFLIVTTPVVITAGLTVAYLATVKPF